MAIDASNMALVLEGFESQCRKALDYPKGMFISGEIESIAIIGMGGSGIVGDIIKAVLIDSKLPIQVIRDYTLPQSVNSKTLVFSVSHSGKTEETLSATKEAIKRGAKVVAITSGGELSGLTKKPIMIPGDTQPRCALGSMFFPILGVLANSKLIEVKNEDLTETFSLLSDLASIKDRAQKIAKMIKERTPIIYCSESLRPVAMRWKTQFNENAKLPAYFNSYSELTHNEICAIEHLRRSEAVILHLRDTFDHPQIKRRMDISREHMKQTVDVIEVGVNGKSLLARIFSTIALGDWTSYYLAIQNRTDPTPVLAIDKLKRQMG